MPPGFDDQHVTTVTRATALAFTPDGRMLATGKDGTVHVIPPGAAPQVALNIPQKTCFDNERGVLGTAVDPLFAQNRFIYLYYTFKKFGVCDRNTPTAPVNRVSRFVLPDTNVIDPATETVLIDNIPSPDGIHNAGDLGFGQDGYLYASVGDGGCDFRGDSGCALLNDAARDLAGLSGKLLRITRDGASPPGNPFMAGPDVPCRLTGSTNAPKRCTEIYASGLRNPFRFAFDPGSTRLNINDVGEAKWEEVDRAAPGADYGWNVREGPCVRDSRTNCGPPPAGMTNPIHSYDHLSGCTSITVGFVRAGRGVADAARRRVRVRRPRVRKALRADRAAGWRDVRAGVRHRDGQPDRLCIRAARHDASPVLHLLGAVPERLDPEDLLRGQREPQPRGGRGRRPHAPGPYHSRSSSTALKAPTRTAIRSRTAGTSATAPRPRAGRA